MSACCVLVDDAKICLLRLWLSMQPACNPATRPSASATPSDTCHQAVPIGDRSRAELDNHEALSNPEGTALVGAGTLRRVRDRIPGTNSAAQVLACPAYTL